MVAASEEDPILARHPKDSIWAHVQQGFDSVIELTEDAPRAQEPRLFVGSLRPPQATILRALMDIVRWPYRRVHHNGVTYTVCQTAAIVSEPPSAGKTVLVIAFACALLERRQAEEERARLPPRRFPLQPTIGVRFRDANIEKNILHATRAATLDLMPPYLEVVDPPMEMNMIMVVASASVIAQWHAELGRFAPTLRVFAIEGVQHLRAFDAMLVDGTAQGIDVLLVKIGTVTPAYRPLGEKPRVINDTGAEEPPAKSILMRLVQTLGPRRLRAVVYDDLDVINHASGDGMSMLMAQFTLLVSATRKQVATMNPWLATDVPTLSSDTTASAMIARHLGTWRPHALFLDDFLNVVGNLHCSEAYSKAHMEGYDAHFHVIRVRGGAAAQILGDLGVNAEHLEALHAGAVHAAADQIVGDGHAVRTVGDIVRLVLRDHVDRLIALANMITRIDNIRKKLDTLPFGAEMAGEAAVHTAANRTATQQQVAEGLAALALLTHASTKLRTHVGESLVRTKEQYDTTAASITRMRDNLRGNGCSICQLDFEEGEPVTVLNCCQTAMCKPCSIATIRRQQCPQCASRLTVDNMFCINSGMIEQVLSWGIESLPQMLEQKPVAEAAAPAAPAPTEDQEALKTRLREIVDAAEIDPANRPRFVALLHTMYGLEPECVKFTRDTAPFADVLIGAQHAPPPPLNKETHQLVFCLNGELVKHLCRLFVAADIRFLVLDGTVQHRNDVLQRFRREGGALIITTLNNSAGLNLQYVAYAHLFNLPLNANLRRQAASRITRTGRTCDAVLFAYVNEVEHIEHLERR